MKQGNDVLQNDGETANKFRNKFKSSAHGNVRKSAVLKKINIDALVT